MNTNQLACIMCGLITTGSLITFAPVANAAPDCRDIVIGVGGNGQRQLDVAGEPSLMGRQLEAAATQGFRVQNIDYKSSVWPTGADTKDVSVADGRQKLAAAVTAYRQECPGGHVKVIAHSLGAEFATDVPADEYVLYGDPRFPGGIYQAIPWVGVLPVGITPAPVRTPDPLVTDVCHEFDAICDSPVPWEDPARFMQGLAGALIGWHNYTPDETDGRDPGQYLEPEPMPLPTLPAYVPTPLRDYIPDELEPLLPPEVLNFVPPPLPGLRLP